jgi:hypothetical protein
MACSPAAANCHLEFDLPALPPGAGHCLFLVILRSIFVHSRQAPATVSSSSLLNVARSTSTCLQFCRRQLPSEFDLPALPPRSGHCLFLAIRSSFTAVRLRPSFLARLFSLQAAATIHLIK